MKERLEELQRQYEEKLAHKEELRKKAELTELRLERAAKLVSGLAGERVRWEENVKVMCVSVELCLGRSKAQPELTVLFVSVAKVSIKILRNQLKYCIRLCTIALETLSRGLIWISALLAS